MCMPLHFLFCYFDFFNITKKYSLPSTTDSALYAPTNPNNPLLILLNSLPVSHFARYCKVGFYPLFFSSTFACIDVLSILFSFTPEKKKEFKQQLLESQKTLHNLNSKKNNIDMDGLAEVSSCANT